MATDREPRGGSHAAGELAEAGSSPVEARLTEAQLRDLTESLPHLVWTCLAEGPCDYLSRQWVVYTGIPEAEQLEYGWLMQLHPDDRERVEAEWAATVGKAEPFDIEFRIRRADGVQRWFRTRAIPLRDDSGHLVKWYGSNTDIEDYKQAESAFRTLNENLEQLVEERTDQLLVANRELESFSYSVAHELRAPLRAMSGFAGIVLDEHGSELEPVAVQCLGQIQENAQRMSELIDALLSLARVTRGEVRRERIDLSALARDVVLRLAAAEPERNVEVIVKQGLVAWLDPALARTLFLTLVTNAWKFSRGSDEPMIEIGATSIDGVRAFFVRDNGAGFDMEYADKLFVPFQRVHTAKEFPGTGIGLATAQRIVTRHGGRIWAEGRVGRGATFFFAVPEPSGGGS